MYMPPDQLTFRRRSSSRYRRFSGNVNLPAVSSSSASMTPLLACSSSFPRFNVLAVSFDSQSSSSSSSSTSCSATLSPLICTPPLDKTPSRRAPWEEEVAPLLSAATAPGLDITPNRGASSGVAPLTTLVGACFLPTTPSFRTGGILSPETPAGAESTAVLFSPTSSPPPPLDEARERSPSSPAGSSGLTLVFCVSVAVVDASNVAEAETRLSKVLSPVSVPVGAASAAFGATETVVALLLVLLLPSLVGAATPGPRDVGVAGAAGAADGAADGAAVDGGLAAAPRLRFRKKALRLNRAAFDCWVTLRYLWMWLKMNPIQLDSWLDTIHRRSRTTIGTI